MKRAAAILAALACLLPAAAAVAQAPKQIEWVGDLPVMPGLAIESGLGFAFDSPEGRIVTVYLAGAADAAEIGRYYEQALDPLGWDLLSRGTWRREGETLTIGQVPAAGATLWKVTIRPE